MGRSNIFDVSELDEWAREVLKLAERDMPRETAKFLRDEGGKLRKVTVKKARSRVKKRKGNYFKGIKKGKVYIYSGNGGTSIRVYGGKPAFHAHLLEHGHRMVSKTGEELGFVQGYNVFEDSRNEFAPVFEKDIEDFIDKITEEL